MAEPSVGGLPKSVPAVDLHSTHSLRNASTASGHFITLIPPVVRKQETRESGRQGDREIGRQGDRETGRGDIIMARGREVRK